MQLRANTNWGEMTEQFSKISNKGKTTKDADERFYVPGKDSDGNVAAVIRFLPSPDSPAILVESKHFIKGADGVYTEDCPKAHGKSCPACSWIGKAWGDGDKNAYKKWGAKDKFIANILIINDVNKPENNGKVFLYKFGKGIYNMIESKVNPQDGLDEPSIIFDYETGENFKLVGSPASFATGGKTIEYVDFKRSEFKGSSRLGTDDEITAADSGLHEMTEWLPEKALKSYDELKVILDKVVSTDTINNTPVTTTVTNVAQKSIDESVADEKAIDALISGKTETVVEEPDTNDIMAKLNAIRAEQ